MTYVLGSLRANAYVAEDMRLFWIIVAILFFIVPIVLNVIIGAPNPLSNIVGNDVDWLAFLAHISVAY